MIPYSCQSISEDDIAAVTRVLRSDFLTQGPEVPAFEAAVASYCGVRYATAVSNGTAALHLACLAMGLGPGDRLWTSAISFAASANCARYCGAEVDFVDIDPATGNLSINALEQKLARAEKEGCLPRIVVPVHLAGLSCDMEAIRALADRYGFFVLEDASHALGATYLDQPVGCCRWSHAAVFSFHAVKMITTGEGGMVVTNDEAIHAKCARLRTHGITRDASEMHDVPHGSWYYEQVELGWNYRLTDIQAALGTSQMKRLPDFLAARRRLAARYDELLSELPVQLPARTKTSESSWHLYVIRVDFDAPEMTQRAFYDSLRADGIGVQLHYIPIPMHPYYRRLGFRMEDYPEAMKYYRQAVSLPLHQRLTDEAQDLVVEKVARLLRR